MLEQDVELSIIMPCLNEELTLRTCIRKAKQFLQEHNVVGEIVIGDNGSTDKSIAIAQSEGAIVANIKEKGYGAALNGAIAIARGKYIIMGDSDDSYDFSHLELFLEKLRADYDVVMGNRFKGGIAKGAMPFLHRYLGNPVLSFLGRLFFNIKVRDFHCGIRGGKRKSILKLELITTGMEFASEMVVKSALMGLNITEVPTKLAVDGRDRPPHLRTWRDGWRHLRFLLMYSPRWLFLYPGITLFVISILLFTVILLQPIHARQVTFDIHTLTICGSLIVLSFQIILFYLLSNIYAINQGLKAVKKSYNTVFKYFTLEAGLISGALIFVVGFSLLIHLFSFWQQVGYGQIKDLSASFRLLIPAIVLQIIGTQTIFFSFLFSTLGIVQKVKYK